MDLNRVQSDRDSRSGRPSLREVEHLFHFRTVPLLLVFGFVLGFVAAFGRFGAFATVVLGVGATLTALKCLIWPQWVGRGRLAVPVGRLDACVWLSITFIPVLLAMASLLGLPSNYYIDAPH